MLLSCSFTLQTNKSLVAAPGVDDHDAVKMGLQVSLLLEVVLCVCSQTSPESPQRNRELLFDGLANNTVKITALDLSSCGIDDATVIQLGIALKVCGHSCLLVPHVGIRFMRFETS